MSNPEKETSPGNPLIVQIDEKLRGLPSNHSTCCIFKVPSRLRHVNERAFEPEILSIGPYHRGKDKLKMMEEHKKRYLQELLQRRGESSVERYIEAMRGVEGKAREFYDQSVSLCQDEFVEMLLLDGCFIVELIRKCNNIPGASGEDDPVFEVPWILSCIETESLFRNLDAYEQCSLLKHLYVTDYITLMDCLISTQEDVQILRHSEIIENGLGDDGKVCSLFNNLCRNVTDSQRRHFCYNEVFNRVNEHCNRKRNVWMATLKHDYFNSPWALLSFLAAVVLLLFTLAQTVFTVMSYFQMD
ncbi:hypothetical protein POTOM_014419 [Populus tomentosa]|uniref:Uncharacterized protein n=1 Tax=Populus tomentosa TaxID=118781 RepID=A0A8X8D7T0_POPTO|nr:hypothetical protein POTOM_014419 [Populus tomentosa]